MFESKKPKTYYVATSKRNNGKTLVIEARRCVDYLSCEAYDYFGQRETTKRRLRQERYSFLAWLKTKRPGVYGACVFAVVD